MHYEAEKVWFEASLPPEEQIAEFLMAFRFFYLQDEQTHFLKILSILGKHAAQAEGRKFLKMMKVKWHQALFGNALQMKIGSKRMTASLVIDLWFNAHYFHSDEPKEAELEKLKKILTPDFAKFMLLNALYESAKLIAIIYKGLYDVTICLVIGVGYSGKNTGRAGNVQFSY